MENGYAIAAAQNLAIDLTLAIHLAWILWVVFGAFWTRGRRWLTALHLASLVWGIVVETGPWPCPLTLTEQFLEGRAGRDPFEGGFLLHFLQGIVYPDLPAELLTVAAVVICGFNLAIYASRGLIALRMKRKASS